MAKRPVLFKMSNLNAIHVSPQFWSELEGRLLESKYILGTCLHATDTHGIFQTTITGAYVRSATLKISTLEGEQQREQLALWELVRTFDHPNLMRILMTGRTEVDGVPAIYAVMEAADESLAGVLQERRLDGVEAKQVLESILEALKYIHAHNLVHGSLEPRNILAVGENIKISTDSLQRMGEIGELPDEPANQAPEVKISGTSAASDIYAVGATLFEVLTQQPPTPDELAQIEWLPIPLGEIIQHCLESKPENRWTSKQIWAALRAHPEIITPVPPPPAVPEVKEEVEETPQIIEEPVKKPEPLADILEKPVSLTNHPEPEHVGEPARLPKWPFAAAGLVFILFLLWSMFRKGPEEPKPTAPPAAAAQKSASPSPAPPPALTPHVASPASETPQAEGTGNWRVIAFTYTREADAAAKVKAINAKRPALKAEVFTPNKGRSPYLVALGGWMTVDASKRFRREAISLGMPRDTYAQNFRR